MGATKTSNDGATKKPTKSSEPEATVYPTPPDGGWGWVVVVASFFSNLLVDGVLYTFGILYVELMVAFPDVSKGKITLVGSLLGGLYLMGGPVVSALANKFGCRPVAIAGSIITATAFAVSYFAKSVDMLLITYGVIGGFGFGMLYLPSIVMVGLYFDKRRAMATGVAVCGSGIGAFVFAPLGRYLNDNYGWRGSLLILSGLMLNGVACGAVYRPLTTKKRPKKKEEEEEGGFKETHPDGEEGEAAIERVRPFQRQDVLYAGSVTNLNEYKKSENMAAYVSSVTSIPRPEDETAVSPITNVLKTMFDFSLLLSPTFVVLCLSGVFGFMGFFTPYIYLTDFSSQHGIDPHKSSLLLSVCGIASTVSRLATGWLADRTWADSLVIHNVAIILAGVSTCLLPLFTSAPLLFFYAVTFGALLAGFIALRSIVLCDLLGVQKLTNSFGLLVLFQGIALFTGSYMSGSIYQSTGSHTVSFLVAGLFMVVAGLVALPARWIARREDGKNAKTKKGEITNDLISVKSSRTEEA